MSCYVPFILRILLSKATWNKCVQTRQEQERDVIRNWKCVTLEQATKSMFSAAAQARVFLFAFKEIRCKWARWMWWVPLSWCLWTVHSASVEDRRALSFTLENPQNSLSTVFFLWKYFLQKKQSLWKLLTAYSRVAAAGKRCYFWVFGHTRGVKGGRCQPVRPPLWRQYLNNYWTDCCGILYRRSCSPEDEFS